MSLFEKKPKSRPGTGAGESIKLPSGKKVSKPAPGLLAKARAKISKGKPVIPPKSAVDKVRTVPVVAPAPQVKEPRKIAEAKQELPSRILSEKPFSVFIPDEDYNALFPSFYNETRIVLMARDSHWLFTYWEVNQDSVASMRENLGGSFDSAVPILRVCDVTNVIFDGGNANRSFDVRISEGSSSWYLHAGDPNRRWVVEIGMLLPDGRFVPYTRSNTIKTPADCVASVMDEEWAISQELMKRAYPKEWHLQGAGQVPVAQAGTAGEAGVSKGTAGTLKTLGGSESVHGGSSGWLSSWSSPGGGKEKTPLFWLRVGTELIIYGATEPDASVTMNGKPVKLAEDGTFGTRFNLNEGEHTVTIEARSADGIFTRAYTIDVTKYTGEGK